ncbi:MAG: methionyl-tRNA formyltransferase [Treponema sp.]|jgi:methionyl-tRNA formyltransferase|nr:methionyl-tRNA formyltransferase [Treponema sp.]
MRILFAGSPAIAVPALKSIAALSGGGIELAALLTRADSPRGRGGKPEPTDCALAARHLSAIPVLKPEKLDSAARGQVAALKTDFLVSFAYGKIFGPQFLALFPLGGVNIHPSLLPKYRGPTPIPAAILNRETVTGITIQHLAAEVDSGDILLQETVPLNGRETTASLNEIMAEKAAELLPAALGSIANGDLRAQPQDHRAATYCSLVNKGDGLIDWNRSAVEIDARIRAFDPWPLSWTMHGDLQLFILQAEALEAGGESPSPGRVLGKDKEKGILIQTGEGILAVNRLQYQTKKALEWKNFLNGARNFLEAKLG